MGSEDLVQADSGATDSSEKVTVRSEWRPIESAPRDGTKIDLLFPYPRGRTINCFWGAHSLHIGEVWVWRTPTWKDGELLPEDQWNINCYGSEPTHWMPAPLAPDSSLTFSNEAVSDQVSLNQTSLKPSE